MTNHARVKLIFCYLTFTIGLFKQSNILFARFRWSAPVLDKLFWLAKRSIVRSFGCVSKERWDSRSLGQRSAAEPTQLRANQTWTKSPWAFYALQKKAIFLIPRIHFSSLPCKAEITLLWSSKMLVIFVLRFRKFLLQNVFFDLLFYLKILLFYLKKFFALSPKF